MSELEVKNKVTFEHEQVKSDDERRKKSEDLMKRSGEVMKPVGYEHVGSATVHFYKNMFAQDNFSTVTMSQVSRVPEGFADMGWKELRKSLMRAFGRES